MHAVIRETNYPPEEPVYESREFQRFQEEHARLSGYKGTIVVDAGGGRFLTLTLWDSLDEMATARHSMGPVVEDTLESLMTTPAKLVGTGVVVVNDLTQSG